MHALFSDADSDHDHRIDLDEFQEAVAHAKTWGLEIGPSEAEDVFNEIDVDGGGKILFVEFANWILPLHLKREADGDEDEEDVRRDVDEAGEEEAHR